MNHRQNLAMGPVNNRLLKQCGNLMSPAATFSTFCAQLQIKLTFYVHLCVRPQTNRFSF